jgi:hypothetical protein
MVCVLATFAGYEMANDEGAGQTELLSPKDLQKWLLQEQADSARAHELRVKSATELATSYALGELTPEQANQRFLEHDRRWGEALPGTHAFVGSTDEQLIASIDKARTTEATGFEQRFGNRDRGASGQKRG